jgi:outer membrane receptor protein involved in Fe transport
MSGLLVLTGLALHAQSAVTLTVEDGRGAALAGAVVQDSVGRVLGRSNESGAATFNCVQPCRVRVTAPGFSVETVAVDSAAIVKLAPAGNAEMVTVTAYRTPLGTLESPATTRLLTNEDLANAPAVTLDGKMRQVPGVETFRRSSSLVANPTSQGISLRGLGSTSASRTLVTQDDVPLNDPLGGWIHWNETPELAVRSVEVVRGGASDMYGSSAIGGVLNVMEARPGNGHAEMTSTYGANGTYDAGALAEGKLGAWGLLGSAGMLGTNGFIQQAPWQRGPVDNASNVHSQNALVDIEHQKGRLRLFVRGNGFNEQRHNGTPYQMNATRLIRYATGGDWRTARNEELAVRLFGSDERYRQTFSSIVNTPNAANPKCNFRCGETPSKFTYAPVNELGGAAHWTEPLAPGLLLVAGADVRDVRVWDKEQSFGTAAAITDLHDRQRDTGIYAEVMWVRGPWTVTGSARMDWFQNFNVEQFTWNGTAFVPSAVQPPEYSQHLFDPRMGISRKIGDHWSVVASGFRAFRSPTPSELYRSTQVGNQLTRANNSLLSERATGWETGVASERHWGTVRASYFMTQVNRPIAAVTINPNSNPILLQRQNLGQIESQGMSLDYEVKPLSWVAVDGGYQYAHAVVSKGSTVLGKWIPAVARNMATMNVRATKPKLGTLALMGRISGRQYDDDANVNLLHSYFRMDLYASHTFGQRIEVFTAAENLFDRTIEISKTPSTTLDAGRTARAGFRLQLWTAGK